MSGSAGHAKVLFLSPWNPYPPVFGARARVLSLLRALATNPDREVHLLSFAEPGDEIEASRRHLAGLGIEARLIRQGTARDSRARELPARLRAALHGIPFHAQLCRDPALSDALRLALREHQYRLVVAETSWMGQHVAAGAGVPKLLSWQNVDFDVYARRAAADRNPLVRAIRRYNFRLARRFELSLLPRFDGLLLVSEADREILLGHAGLLCTPTHVAPICTDTAALAPAAEEGRRAGQLLFVGAMFYQPNVEAVLRFHAGIYPLLRRRFPAIRLVVAGRDPAGAVRALARDDPSVVVTGTLDDLAACYAESAVFVAPIRHGGGMKTKIVEAMAAGVPVVATSFALQGIEARDGEEALLADEPEAFAAAVARLLEDRELRRRLAAAARTLVERRYSQQALARLLDAITAPLLAPR